MNAAKFVCPTCRVLSNQRWSGMILQFTGNNLQHSGTRYRVGRCDGCESLSIWFDGHLVFPRVIPVPACNSDASSEVKADYVEAASILASSPRASCALLRLAMQRLCGDLGVKEKDLNAGIGELVKRGLPEQIRQSLDVVRVIGNNQVHPGTLDVRDDPDIAQSLFDLVNLVIEYMISNPRRIQELHNRLPATALDQIRQRDLKVKQISET